MTQTMDKETQFSLNQPQSKSHQTVKSVTASLGNLHRSSSPSSRAVAKAIRQAEDRQEGGVVVYLHSSTVSGKELRTTLESFFPGPEEYSVQVGLVRHSCLP